ncbi:protein LNK1-like isoform X2 [Tripterygium wilfordii]|uniref:protein LNK1-like isoform X2 n=1 Tax=Tripterygium wilfordii TaxID=458696 RepID=UPI0018F82E2A|nr:protein LNK1-like isoform X2 [Tripterygium wilfordii]
MRKENPFFFVWNLETEGLLEQESPEASVFACLSAEFYPICGEITWTGFCEFQLSGKSYDLLGKFGFLWSSFAFKFEDSAWDEFGGSDDHIVPHPTGGYVNQFQDLNDGCKKPRCEVIITNYADKAKYIDQGRDKTNLATLTDKDKMLEKHSWNPDGVFHTSCDASFKEVERAASDAARMSSDSSKSGDSGGTELYVDNPILGEGGAAADVNLYHYPLSHISQVDNDLNFLENDREDKDSSDLFYGWSDIGNFEDVDRMFRGCDSSFGLGILSHEDELNWFPPSHATEVNEDALKFGSQFTCSEERALSGVSEHHEGSRSNDAIPSINDGSRSFSTVDKINPWALHASNHSSIGQISFLNGPALKYGSSDGRMANEQRQSSYASNPVQSMESSYCATCDASDVATNLKRENLYHRKDLEASFNGKFQHENMVSQSAFCDPVLVQKQAHQSKLEIEGHSEVGGVSVGIQSELDSSNAQESSSVSSLLDELSVEASSFRQLQKAMEQLDIRTKLCIRDSLYRLATSAEQRHNCRNSNSAIKTGRETSGAPLTEETDKLIDMETDTNPIDRSIAHLLFHRPSDPSARPTSDVPSLRPMP